MTSDDYDRRTRALCAWRTEVEKTVGWACEALVLLALAAAFAAAAWWLVTH